MPDLALLVEGGIFFSGKRRCTVSVDDADSVEAATAKIWAALGMEKQASRGNIEIFEASWDEYVVFEDKDQLANKAKLRLAPSSASADSPVEPPAYTESSLPPPRPINGPVVRVGATLDNGRYTILESIGVGGMGEIMKANDSLLNRKLVLKFPLTATDAIRMHQETKFLAMVGQQTSHVMAVYEFKREGDLAYMVGEFLDGKNVRQLLDQRKPLGLEEHQIVQITIGVLEALIVIHAHNFVHRDIKPSNIMWLEAPPHVKLIDFGITKSLNEQDNVMSTTTGSTPGTKPYMSPSAFQGKMDFCSDIWALTVSVLETAIGYVPENLAFTAPVPVGELRQKGYSEPFIGFIDKGLQKDPLNGFKTAVEALDQAKLLPSARAKTGLTSMKKQLADIQQEQKRGHEVVVEKLDENKRQLEENQALLREQGAVVTAMAGRFANMEGSMQTLTRLNRAELRLIEELVRDEICCPRLIWIMPKPKVQTHLLTASTRIRLD
jgi:hypothetical protein